MKHYRSSIPKRATECVLATHISGPQKYLAEYRLNGRVVGFRQFDQDGEIQSERPVKDGLTHGTQYFFDPGTVAFSEPYKKGLAHGTARQYSEEGRLIGTYSMIRGTGIDLWRHKTNWGTGPSVFLSEARYFRDGMRHGFEWWLNENQNTVSRECHFKRDRKHGIERAWTAGGRLKRGYPKYWIDNQQVTKRQYLREMRRDLALPSFRDADNRPKRTFPPEIRRHLT